MSRRSVSPVSGQNWTNLYLYNEVTRVIVKNEGDQSHFLQASGIKTEINTSFGLKNDHGRRHEALLWPVGGRQY